MNKMNKMNNLFLMENLLANMVKNAIGLNIYPLTITDENGYVEMKAKAYIDRKVVMIIVIIRQNGNVYFQRMDTCKCIKLL